MTTVDVLVIGAGPAGLAVGGAMKKINPNLKCILLEAAEVVGNAWFTHYDRLHLHTHRDISYLPFKPYPKSYPTFPSRQQVVDYLVAYAKEFELDVRLRHKVTAVRKDEKASDGTLFRVTATNAETGKEVVFSSKVVVVATGQNGRPIQPDLPGRASFKGTIMHSKEYRNGEAFKGKRVLVVGFGNSGAEISLDLMEHGAKPTVLIRKDKVNIIPRDRFEPGISALNNINIKKYLRPYAWYLDKVLGPLMTLPVPNLRPYGVPQVVPGYFDNKGILQTLIEDKEAPHIDIGQCAAIKRGDIKVLRGSLVGFTPGGVTIQPPASSGKKESFEEGFDAVLLATGYHECFSHLFDAATLRAVVDAKGKAPAVSGGESAVPGLYFVGWEDLFSRLNMINLEARLVAEEVGLKLGGGDAK